MAGPGFSEICSSPQESRERSLNRDSPKVGADALRTQVLLSQAEQGISNLLG